MSGRTFAIGDIHGCSKTFDKLLSEVLNIQADDTLFLLGDYIDRGPDSKKVIDIIINLMENGTTVYPLMGNHEQLLLDSVYSDENHLIWIYNGAKNTLLSFGVRFARELDKKYLQFFKSLEYFYIYKDFLLVHGGVNFEIDNPIIDTYSMVWLRNKEVYPEKIGGRKMIVGHTPVSFDIVRSSLSTNKIMLDGGCIYLGKYSDLGYLCALNLDTMELYRQINIDFDKLNKNQ